MPRGDKRSLQVRQGDTDARGVLKPCTVCWDMCGNADWAGPVWQVNSSLSSEQWQRETSRG